RAAQVAFVPEAERESLLAGASRGKPLVGNQVELRKHGAHLGAAMNPEAASGSLDDAYDTAQALALAAFEAEFTQRDPAFLSQLEEREPHLEVEGKVVLAHLIERRRGAVTVGERAKLPGEVLAVARRADRIAHGDEAAALHTVHHERGPVVRKEERLVAEQRQVG